MSFSPNRFSTVMNMNTQNQKDLLNSVEKDQKMYKNKNNKNSNHNKSRIGTEEDVVVRDKSQLDQRKYQRLKTEEYTDDIEHKDNLTYN
eukprot:CAMPEP_0116897862 /NCGR_PEP_ID=MMETSP0467-20121206/6723_1 /TAXON_ID=283647 /ORGANISM="Mesodinium pulex, Strain SPMC105" /LENGTH=88 /DNA_ID=CAMNT_0004569691 /DNA_START=1232 /DNA_END=1498 /DNA_ORIENTATION=-